MKTKRIVAAICLIALMCLPLAACKENPGEITKLSFQAASGYDYLKTLDGTQVSISGYMATSSPVDGSFIFLMNLPYQSCPFCVPNTSQLSNTMEVYPKNGEAFSYTNQAIKVVGKLVVAESEDKPFTDMYGYQFNFKITDAEYTIIQAKDLSEDMALWQKIAQTDVVSEIYRMYDYVNFLCAWNTYYINASTDKNGNIISGFCLSPSDAMYMLQTEDAQYHYGYAEDYFDKIVESIESVDPNAFSHLTANVRKAETLAKKALAELENGNYTSAVEYVEPLQAESLVYTLNKEDELIQEMQTIYAEFANWLGSWEM